MPELLTCKLCLATVNVIIISVVVITGNLSGHICMIQLLDKGDKGEWGNQLHSFLRYSHRKSNCTSDLREQDTEPHISHNTKRPPPLAPPQPPKAAGSVVCNCLVLAHLHNSCLRPTLSDRGPIVAS